MKKNELRPIIDLERVHESLHRYVSGETINTVKVIHSRSRNRGSMLRIMLDNENSVVVKIWRLKSIKERMKAVACLSNGRREWLIHQYIHKKGIECPEPIAFFSMRNGQFCTYEAMVVEDFGETTKGLTYLKNLLANGNKLGVQDFEKRLIDITVHFISMRLTDVDHQLNNFIVDRCNRLVRVDFECARRHFIPGIHHNDTIKMIARLITSHIYAVQPRVNLSVNFAQCLYAKLNFNKIYRMKIQLIVQEILANQFLKNGLETKVKLPV